MLVTPYQYIVSVRLKESKKRLIGTSNTIEDIALNCGFSTPSHSINCFKNDMEMTPGEFRALLTETK